MAANYYERVHWTAFSQEEMDTLWRQERGIPAQASRIIADALNRAEEWTDWNGLNELIVRLRDKGMPIGFVYRAGFGVRLHRDGGYLHLGWLTDKQALDWLWDNVLCKAALPAAVRPFTNEEDEIKAQ